MNASENAIYRRKFSQTSIGGTGFINKTTNETSFKTTTEIPSSSYTRPSYLDERKQFESNYLRQVKLKGIIIINRQIIKGYNKHIYS